MTLEIKKHTILVPKLLITINGSLMRNIDPVTPGVAEDDPFNATGITQCQLAKQIGVTAQQIGDLMTGSRAITSNTDFRLCRFCGLSNGYWLRVRLTYDTEISESLLPEQLSKIGPYTKPTQVRPASHD